MLNRLFRYLNPTRPMRRGEYLLAGLLLFTVKFAVDTTVSLYVFDRAWSPANYLIYGQMPLMSTAPLDYLTGMAITAFPFVVVGLLLTLRRLRAVQLPVGFVVCFFVPFLNLLFFIAILLPADYGTPAESIARPTPPKSKGTPFWATVPGAALLAAIVALPSTLFSIYGLKHYGGGLFIGMPFCVGMFAAVLHGYSNRPTAGSCSLASLWAVLDMGILLFVFQFEGIGCLLMAAPLLLLCALVGGWIGYGVQQSVPSERIATLVAAIILLILPSLMGAEWIAAPTPPLYAVRTSVIVATPPDAVWRNVVSFPDLPPPDDWVFSTGVAFPTRATIDGIGPGAIRRCEFSTGTFVEPIEIWDEPHLLHFSVTENPPPMREWSFGGDIHPPHLEGFMFSRAGQFLLQPLPGGQTRLEGTTWYEHDLWPTAYWRLWSDFLIHRIHRRVLEHVRTLSENPVQAQ